MSTVPEAIAARHCGMRVFGMSLITDMVGTEEGKECELTHEDVLKLASQRAVLIQKIILKFIEKI